MINVFDKNLRRVGKPNRYPALEIRVHLVDGSQESFIQTHTSAAQEIRRRAATTNIFAQTRLVLADDYSKSVFVCSQINRIDLLFNDLGISRIPPDHADLVELTGTEFRSHVPLHHPAHLEKREQLRQVGDLMVSFLHLRMRGGSHIYLMNETIVKVPAESQSFMQRLLSKSVFCMRLPGGGQGYLNLQNLVGYTVYPGVSEVPSDTWMAKQKEIYEEAA